MKPMLYADYLVVGGVCAHKKMAVEAIEMELNMGRKRLWRIKVNAVFQGERVGFDTRGGLIYGEPAGAPIPCPERPTTHRHFIVETGA